MAERLHNVQHKGVKFMDNVKEYVDLVNEPWGRMFYDLLFTQLDIPQLPKRKILDFGSGLCVTSNHYAEWHDVTAIEPNTEMISNSCKGNEYKQIHGGIEKIAKFNDNSFDLIFCHNVLEYVENKEPIVSELLRVLKHGGSLSVVKHNRKGKVFHSAVFWNDPQKAHVLLDSNANDKSNYLGTQYIYSNECLSELASKHNGVVKEIFGIRAFYAMSQDNTIKYTNEWYQNMFALEKSVAYIDEYLNTAFYNHLIISKSK